MVPRGDLPQGSRLNGLAFGGTQKSPAVSYGFPGLGPTASDAEHSNHGPATRQLAIVHPHGADGMNGSAELAHFRGFGARAQPLDLVGADLGGGSTIVLILEHGDVVHVHDGHEQSTLTAPKRRPPGRT